MEDYFLYGLGLDGEYPHKYITKGDNFHLFGGSRNTHDKMLDNVMRFNKILKKYGKKMDQLTREEYYQIVEEIGANKAHWGFFQ